MKAETKIQLAGMFSCFPQSPDIDPDAYLQGLLIACEGLGDAAIVEAVAHVVAGKLPSVNPSFCPSTAAFGAYARLLHDRNELAANRLNRPALTPPRRSDTMTGYDKWLSTLSPAERAEHVANAKRAAASKRAVGADVME